ncbi:MAG: hypothetical protein O7E52_11930 [Candidatus Poribacteria bacterium]|nr:hypothetical protein [Candidatus Poribacteria bacterium]
MALFGRKSRNTAPKRHELLDIPIGSMIELSDPITFETSETASRTFELIERKKYDAQGFSRYMYRLEDDDEEVVLGIDRIAGTNEYEVSRWIIDSEEELDEDLPDRITLHYPDADDEEREISVEYVRNEIIPAQMHVVNVLEMETFDVELYEYASEGGGLMSVELCGNWLIFYVGELIALSDINIYPAEEEEEYIDVG